MPDEDERVRTGIEGFDEMTRGGFPKNSVNVITGRAGSGKTLFSVHYAVEGARQGESTLYLSVDDMAESVLRGAEQYDIGVRKGIDDGYIHLYDYERLNNELGQELISFDDLTRSIDQLLSTAGGVGGTADRLVIDSVAGLGIAENSVNEIRRGMLRFIRRVRENNVTALLVTEKWEDELTRYGAEEYVGDSITVLGLEQMQNQMDRSINIRKMRYTDHDTAFRPLEITDSGIIVHRQGQVF